MKRSHRTSSFPLIFACVLLTLFLHAPVSATTLTKSSNNVIRVWTVGSPHTGALPPAVVPPAVRQRAESLGYTIQIETFRANGFAARFRQAFQNHEEPEILTFDNFGVLLGIRVRTGWVEGIDSDRSVASSLALVHETLTPLQARGWVMLVRSAVNYEAARTLSMPAAECEAQHGRAPNSPIEPALRQIQETAVLGTRAYLDCDRSALSEISDESRLTQQCFLPKSKTKLESVNICSVSGNHKLAFVSLVSIFSAETFDPTSIGLARYGMDLGQQSILAVLRNESGIWRLLAITHDPMNTVGRVPLTTNTLVNSLDHGPSTGVTVESARLLTPNGVHPVPKRCERFGDFTWQPSQSSEVIGQVVEFTWGQETNYWGLTRLFFLPPGEDKISSGLLMSGGLSKWRVWSISKGGDVAFSGHHIFPSYATVPR